MLLLATSTRAHSNAVGFVTTPASNGDEVAFLADDTRPTVLQASLEVYAPLTNSSHLAANLAQSLSEVILNGV